MLPKKSVKVAGTDPWEFINNVDVTNVQKQHIYGAFRLTDFNLCMKMNKPNCEENPFCLFGLGEKKWSRSKIECKDDVVLFNENVTGSVKQAQRRKEVEWLYPIDVSFPYFEELDSNIVVEIPERKPFYSLQELDFVSTTWFRQWLDKEKPIPQIDNDSLKCTHNKLAPPKPHEKKCPYKIVPSALANVWYSNYNGGPRFRKNDICDVCVKDECKRFQDSIKISLAKQQKLNLLDTYKGLRRPSYKKIGNFFIVPHSFVIEWRKFVDDPVQQKWVPKIQNRSLLCGHQKLIHPVLFDRNLSTETKELAFPVSPDEWSLMEKYFEYDLSIRGRFNVLRNPQNVDYEPEICGECRKEWFEQFRSGSTRCEEIEINDKGFADNVKTTRNPNNLHCKFYKVKNSNIDSGFINDEDESYQTDSDSSDDDLPDFKKPNFKFRFHPFVLQRYG